MVLAHPEADHCARLGTFTERQDHYSNGEVHPKLLLSMRISQKLFAKNHLSAKIRLVTQIYHQFSSSDKRS